MFPVVVAFIGISDWVLYTFRTDQQQFSKLTAVGYFPSGNFVNEHLNSDSTLKMLMYSRTAAMAEYNLIIKLLSLWYACSN